MRLLVITEYYRPLCRNGSEVFCRALIHYLKAAGHQVHLLARVRVNHPAVTAQVTYPIEDRLSEGDDATLARHLAGALDPSAYDLIYNLGALKFGCRVAALLTRAHPGLPLVNHFQVLLGPLAAVEP